MFKPKKKADILKLMDVSQASADRIGSGMLRLESEFSSWSKFINESSELADNSNECNLIWYFIGIKVGAMAERGMVIVLSDKRRGYDPAIQ